MPTDAVRTVVGIAAGNHSVVSRTSAAASGMTPRNIDTAKRRGWLEEPVPGVLAVAGAPATWRRRAAIVLAAANSRGRLSPRAAVTLFGLDGFPDPDIGCRVQTQGRNDIQARQRGQGWVRMRWGRALPTT